MNKVGALNILAYKKVTISECDIKSLSSRLIKELQTLILHDDTLSDGNQWGVWVNSNGFQDMLFSTALDAYREADIEYYNPITFIHSIMPIFTAKIVKSFGLSGGITNIIQGSLIMMLSEFANSDLQGGLLLNINSSAQNIAINIIVVTKIPQGAISLGELITKDEQKIKNMSSNVENIAEEIISITNYELLNILDNYFKKNK